MNPYSMLGSGIGTKDAASLRDRLTAWHDAMVAHERRLRTGRPGDACDDECPHAEARTLWSEAIETFGPRAHELAFLRSRALDESRRATRLGAAHDVLSEVADSGRPSMLAPAITGHRSAGGASGRPGGATGCDS